ncbi:hypothetical protein BTUL_0181g00230 [Botrytis tulipae]|uniref:Uncharacterized protein n=1 Tax=Botrytis tulipae TaxID=87230 RepID=A0A4Z1EEF6_9HELO|nr:hypothetical protein BTUL_0181g00230 [Botrytis tulipae]
MSEIESNYVGARISEVCRRALSMQFLDNGGPQTVESVDVTLVLTIWGLLETSVDWPTQRLDNLISATGGFERYTGPPK